jgi:hypothetical protein
LGVLNQKKPIRIKEPPFPIMSKTSKNQWLYGNYFSEYYLWQLFESLGYISKLVILKTMVMNLNNFPNNC